MRFATLFPVFLLLAIASGCTSTAPYRKICDGQEMASKNASPECKTSSVEITKHGFQIAYVELTDQGLLHDRRQMTAALSLLKREPQQALQVVLFIHGWKHSASFEDRDVVKFRDVIMQKLASGPPGTRTVGIYVGWRGAVLRGPTALQNITFYDRKSTADHVARGSVRELFSYLRAIREKARKEGRREVRLILVGHSFGGLILYNAIAESLFNSIVAANHADLPLREAEPIADLVLLLNPAFEASRYEPLFQAAKDHLVKGERAPWLYSQKQWPLLVSITSEADFATKTAFPIGRSVNTLLQHEGWNDEDEGYTADYAKRIEKLANTHTIGHMERYRTHRLESGSGRQLAAERGPLDCAALPNPLIADANRFPLWNIYAAREVIENHDDIYAPDLWEFARQLSNGTSLATVCRQ